MKESIIPLVRPQRPTVTADNEPTPLEIQRWEHDGGAVLRVPKRRHVRCRCGADHLERAAA